MMALAGIFISLILGVSLIPQEFERRTIYTILAKPVKRYEFITGKFLGALLTLAIATGLMGVTFIATIVAKAIGAHQVVAAKGVGAMQGGRHRGRHSGLRREHGLGRRAGLSSVHGAQLDRAAVLPDLHDHRELLHGRGGLCDRVHVHRRHLARKRRWRGGIQKAFFKVDLLGAAADSTSSTYQINCCTRTRMIANLGHVYPRRGAICHDLRAGDLGAWPY